MCEEYEVEEAGSAGACCLVQSGAIHAVGTFTHDLKVDDSLDHNAG
jgi:hypothetical protein